ncbi:hypothetical protein AB691_0001 [Stutzerimonas stutzeri]|nr:hypothetical protein AB691_0001 [Stutzerimonas stutzeri]
MLSRQFIAQKLNTLLPKFHRHGSSYRLCRGKKAAIVAVRRPVIHKNPTHATANPRRPAQ